MRNKKVQRCIKLCTTWSDLNPEPRLMMIRWMMADGRTSWNVTGYRVGYVCAGIAQVERSSRRRWNYTSAAGKLCDKNVRSTEYDEPLRVKGVVAGVGRSKKRRRTIKRTIEYERANGRAGTKTHNMAVNDGSYYLNWTDDDDTNRFIKQNVRCWTLMVNNKSHTWRVMMKIRKWLERTG